MHALLLVTLCNAATPVRFDHESAATIVKKHEAALNGTLSVKEALEMIQYRNEIPTLVKDLLPGGHTTKVARRSTTLLQADPLGNDRSLPKVEQARQILNKMYIENQVELDIVIWDCRVYLNGLIDSMDKNTDLRSMLGAAAAEGKAENLEASAGIKEANGELAELHPALMTRQAECKETLDAQREIVAGLTNDYTVGMMIQNATMETCTAAAAGTALVQCADSPDGAEYSFTPGFKHDTLGLGQLTSKEGKEAFARFERVALLRKKEHEHRSFGLMQTRAQRRAVRMGLAKAGAGCPELSGPQILKECDTAATGGTWDGVDMTCGAVAVKTNGGSCEDFCQGQGFACIAAADNDSGDTCKVSSSGAQGRAGTPESASFCTATFGDQLCVCGGSYAIAVSDAHAGAKSMPDRPKCSTEDAPDCPLLLDQVADMVGSILDDLVAAKDKLASQEAVCKKEIGDIEAEIRTWDSVLDKEGIALAASITKENTNAAALDGKQKEYEATNADYMGKKSECDAKKTEIANTMCGIKIVRLEVYNNEGITGVVIEDCEVGDWVDEDCSVTCAGGSQIVKRELIRNYDPKAERPGAACPVTVREQFCNEQDCPIDCEIGDWSPWGACSKDCGGGVRQRTRAVLVESEFGGAACEATDEAQVCDMGACDVDCELAEWSDWGLCSKACNGGIETRGKEIIVGYKGSGKCSDEFSVERFDERPCPADTPCPPNLVCAAKVDIVLVLDGSGSVRPQGWLDTKTFAHSFVSRLDMGESAAKVGIVLYSYYSTILKFGTEADKKRLMTTDKAEALAAIDGMAFPRSLTNTHLALASAMDVLQSGGRQDVPKSNTIVFLVTDGVPNNKGKTNKNAADVRGKGKLFVVPVGSGMGDKGLTNMYSWATQPSEENVLQASSYDVLVDKVTDSISDLCKELECPEGFSSPDMSDYDGCQQKTKSGAQCQEWSDGDKLMDPGRGMPWSDHRYCRNPATPPGAANKDGGIWCYLQEPPQVGASWEYCDPRPANMSHIY